MSLETLVEHYGYLALFLGTLLEGETILLIAGFVAHRGYLSLPGVLIVAFVGTLLGDQSWFYAGRRAGRGALLSRPHWTRRAERVQRVLARHETAVMLGYRFLYGLRSITPFVLGASGCRPARFAVLSAIGAALWTALVGCAGYVFGEAVELVLDDVKRWEHWLMAALAAIGGALWCWRVLQNRRARRNHQA